MLFTILVYVGHGSPRHPLDDHHHRAGHAERDTDDHT